MTQALQGKLSQEHYKLICFYLKTQSVVSNYTTFEYSDPLLICYSEYNSKTSNSALLILILKKKCSFYVHASLLPVVQLFQICCLFSFELLCKHFFHVIHQLYIPASNCTTFIQKHCNKTTKGSGLHAPDTMIPVALSNKCARTDHMSQF